MVDLNQTIQLLGPTGFLVQQFVETVKILVGGIFGIYLITVFIRWREYRVLTKLLRDIRSEVRALNQKLHVHTVKERYGPYERFLRRWEERFGLK